MGKKRAKGRFLASIGGWNIFLLGLVSLLNDFSSEMILPILPLFLASLGADGLALGIVGGIMMGAPELFKVFIGYFSDRIKKRRSFIFYGYLFSQLAKFFLILAKGAGMVMACIGFDKLGKGIREAPRDALISESLPKEKGKAFGIQRTFDSAGAVLGNFAVLGLILFFGVSMSEFDLIKKIIILASIIGFISLIPLLFLKEKTASKKLKKTLFVSLKELPKPIIHFVLAAGIFALANFSYMFFVLKTTNMFNSSDEVIPVIPLILYILFNIFYTLSSIPFGKLADKIGKEKIIIAGYLLFSLICLGFFYFNSLLLYIFLFIAYGLVYAMTVGVQRAFVADLSNEEARATSLGFFQTTIGICSIIAGIIAGLVYEMNSSYIFIYGFSLSFISAIVFIFSRLKFRKVFK